MLTNFDRNDKYFLLFYGNKSIAGFAFFLRIFLLSNYISQQTLNSEHNSIPFMRYMLYCEEHLQTLWIRRRRKSFFAKISRSRIAERIQITFLH